MKILFQLMPALMNIMTGLYFFISAKRMAESGASSLLVALTMVVWAVCYALTTVPLGRVLTKRNASIFVLVSELIMFLALLGLVVMPDVRAQYFWLPGTGIGGAMFFTSFQMVVKLFSKDEYKQESVAKNSAVYTFSWSFGLATGPLIAAFVWGICSPENGWKYCYGISIVMDFFMMAATLCMHRFVKKRLAEPGAAEIEKKPVISPEQQKLPDIMPAVWVMAFFVGSVIAMMRTYLPDYCTKTLNMSTFIQAAIMALISYAQAFSALLCWKAKRWPYKPWIMGTAGIGGTAAMLIFLFCPVAPAYLLAAFMFGTFSGIHCFNITFHALVNPFKTAHYVSVNEMLVGVTSMYAPLAGGFLADHCGVRIPFILCVVLLFATAAFYSIYTWRYRKI